MADDKDNLPVEPELNPTQWTIPDHSSFMNAFCQPFIQFQYIPSESNMHMGQLADYHRYMQPIKPDAVCQMNGIQNTIPIAFMQTRSNTVMNVPKKGRPSKDAHDARQHTHVSSLDANDYIIRDASTSETIASAIEKCTIVDEFTDRTLGYTCNYCNKRCTSKQSFKNHIITHLDIRPYTCKLCGNAFVRRQAIHRHLTSVHAIGTTFMCFKCLAEFPRKDVLKRHLESCA